MAGTASPGGARHRCEAAVRQYSSAVLIACVVSLPMGGCANQAAQTPSPIWQFNATSIEGNLAEPQASAEPVYIYRGGRDPKTGLARIQM